VQPNKRADLIWGISLKRSNPDFLSQLSSTLENSLISFHGIKACLTACKYQFLLNWFSEISINFLGLQALEKLIYLQKRKVAATFLQ
jgi:hypothetical protein